MSGKNGPKRYRGMNIFNMEKEKNYFLHFDDMMGQQSSAEFYLDLIRL